jgi:serine/alanine adding enzyme
LGTTIAVSTLGYEDRRWPEFVTSFHRANIFHSPLLAQVFAVSEGIEIFPLFAQIDREIVAAAIPVLVKLKTRFFGRLVNRLIMFASPLYVDSPQGRAGAQLIVERAKSLVQTNGLFLEIRNSERFPKNPGDVDLDNFDYIPYQNYVLDLSLGAEKLWSSLSGYTRNHVRKSAKKGGIVRDMREEELDTVIDMIRNLYVRKSIPMMDPSIFRNAFSILKPTGNIRAIVLEFDCQLVAARISLSYARTVYDWYAASVPGFNDLSPNEVLAWESIKWGADNDYRIFDFGGGAIKGQDYGPAKFKEKFHGEMVEFGRFRYTPHPLIYALASKAYEMRRSQRKKA